VSFPLALANAESPSYRRSASALGSSLVDNYGDDKARLVRFCLRRDPVMLQRLSCDSEDMVAPDWVYMRQHHRFLL
jgi:hypothetical protein